MLRESSGPLAGLPWSGGWQGDRERNSGLPGAEPRLWALAWDTAGDPSMELWRREAEEGMPCPDMGGGIACVIPKPLPRVIGQDKLKNV